MNIELNNEGNKYSFDVDLNKGTSYLMEIAIKVFDLQRDSFNLMYQNNVLPIEDIPLKEIFKLHSSAISINIQFKNNQAKSTIKQPKCEKGTSLIANNALSYNQLDINCYCKKSSDAMGYCPLCNVFLCQSCLLKHIKTHPIVSLANGRNSIAIYQKNLFTRLNSITNSTKINTKTITEMKDAIIDLLSQSKASIDSIIDRLSSIELAIQNNTMKNDDGLITAIKQSILFNVSSFNSNGNGNANVIDTDANIEQSFRELNKVDKQIREMETVKTPLLLQTQFLSKVHQYSLIIINSINELVIQLKGVMNDSKCSYETIIKRLNSFINSNIKSNDVHSDRMKPHERYYNNSVFSINSPKSLSPFFNEKNIHDQITSETSSLSYQHQINNTPSINKEKTLTEANIAISKKDQLINQLSLSKRILSRNTPIMPQMMHTLNDIDSNLLKQIARVTNHLSPSPSRVNGNNINTALGQKLLQIKDLRKLNPNGNNNANCNCNTNSNGNNDININSHNSRLKELNLVPVKRKNQFRSTMKVLIEDKANEDCNNNILSNREVKKTKIRFIENPKTINHKKSNSSSNAYSKTENDALETRALINNLKALPHDKLLTIKEFANERNDKKIKTILKVSTNAIAQMNNEHLQTTANNNNNAFTMDNPLIEGVKLLQDKNNLMLSLDKITSRSRSQRKKRKMINKYDFLI